MQWLTSWNDAGMGPCAHVVSDVSLLSLRGWTRRDTLGHVPTSSVPCRHCGYLAKRARAKRGVRKREKQSDGREKRSEGRRSEEGVQKRVAGVRGEARVP